MQERSDEAFCVPIHEKVKTEHMFLHIKKMEHIFTLWTTP
jgi:hypothetical protein